jgi:hypothetical protein
MIIVGMVLKSGGIEWHKLRFAKLALVGEDKLNIKGPSIFKKGKDVEYSIFLPEKIDGMNHYVDLVMEGVFLAVERYGVGPKEIEYIKNECKIELGLKGFSIKRIVNFFQKV